MMNAPEPEVQTLGVVELRIPARAEWVAVARLAAAAVGSRMRFSVDEIDDLKLAIAEACTNIIQRSEGIENIDLRWEAGPTELRILLAFGNLALFWKPIVHLFGGQYRLFDVGGAIGLAGMSLMVIVFTLKNTIRLYREERIPQ